MLSCRIPGQESVLGVACCRLSLAHRAGRPRTRRYPSDTTDAQWELVQSFVARKPGPGRPTRIDLRQVVDALMYQARNCSCGKATQNSFRTLLKAAGPTCL